MTTTVYIRLHDVYSLSTKHVWLKKVLNLLWVYGCQEGDNMIETPLNFYAVTCLNPLCICNKVFDATRGIWIVLNTFIASKRHVCLD